MTLPRKEHPIYYRRDYGRRVEIQPTPADPGELEGVLPYEEAVVQLPAERILTFQDIEGRHPPGSYLPVPDGGILIPLGHFALSSGGLRVIDRAAAAESSRLVSGGTQEAAAWTVQVGLDPGWRFPIPVWSVESSDPPGVVLPEMVGSAESMRIGSIALRLIPERGILVRPAREGDLVYLENIPGELRFRTPQQSALFGWLTEKIIARRAAAPADPFLTDLQQEKVYYEDERAGIRISREEARLIRLDASPEGRSRAIESKITPRQVGAGLPLELYEGQNWWLRPGSTGFEMVRLEPEETFEPPREPDFEGEGEGLVQMEPEEETPEEVSIYGVPSRLKLILRAGAWSPQRLSRIIGWRERRDLPLLSAERTGRGVAVPIKLADGTRLAVAEIHRLAGGDLVIRTHREPPFEHRETARLLTRLAALLLEPPVKPVYGPETKLRTLLDALAGSGADVKSYTRRHLAVSALIYRSEPEALEALINHLSGETAPTIRQRIVSGLVERNVRGEKYSPQARMRVRELLKRLLTRGDDGWEPNPFVRRVALQGFVRLTPEGDVIRSLVEMEAGSSYRTKRNEIFRDSIRFLKRVGGDDPVERDPDPEIRDQAQRFTELLRQQHRLGPAKPIDVETGPSDRRFDAGLEEADLEALRRALEAFVSRPEIQRAIQERGGVARFSREALGRDVPEAVVFSEGALLRLDSAAVRGLAASVFAQPEIRRQVAEAAEAAPSLAELRDLPWVELPEPLPDAVAVLEAGWARQGLDVALFDLTLNGVTADSVRRALAPSGKSQGPPRGLLLEPAQALSLTRPVLGYLARAENLPPVVVLVISDLLRDKAGNTYALVLWA